MPILSKSATDELISLGAELGNILPISSRCDSRCVFCSHKNNPPEVLVASVGQRSLEDIKATADKLSGDSEIYIGESATRIIEGEPLTHPDFREIIQYLREKFPYTPIAVTTNGHGLTAEMCEFLAGMGNMVINLSMNSATEKGRALLMGDSPEQARTAIDAVPKMHELGIIFDGSLVAMPALTGWEDIKSSAGYLAENGARSVRIFAPGFSKYAPDKGFPDPGDTADELARFVFSFSDALPCPVLVEPSRVGDLKSTVSGVVKNSPAWRLGLRRGDEILSVDGKAPFSRVECYGLLYPAGEHRLEFIRSGERAEADVKWYKQGGSGLTFEYDFDPRRAEALKKAAQTAPGLLLMLCSQAAYPVLRAVTDTFGPDGGDFALRPVVNKTFGGSIKAAGLLCVTDYIDAYNDFCLETGSRPGCLAVPGESFDYTGRDMKGELFSVLRSHAGVPVAVL